MTQAGTVTQGDIENKHMLTDVVVIKQAANTNLTKGTFVYQDAALGAKVVPTTDAVNARDMRFIENDSNNLTISGIQDGNLGDKNVETYKTGAIVIAKIDGPCTVGQYVRNSTVTAGRVMKLAEPASPVGATPTSAELSNWESFGKLKLAIYLGHKGESAGINNDPTDAVDGDLVRLQLI